MRRRQVFNQEVKKATNTQIFRVPVFLFKKETIEKQGKKETECRCRRVSMEYIVLKWLELDGLVLLLQ